MDKRLVVLVVVFAALVGMAGIGYAMCGSCPGDTKSVGSAGSFVNAGNKICPVTGEAVTEGSKATYEYKGKVYNLCCAMCINEFKKDPEKYAAKAASQSSSAPAEAGHEGHPH